VSEGREKREQSERQTKEIVCGVWNTRDESESSSPIALIPRREITGTWLGCKGSGQSDEGAVPKRRHEESEQEAREEEDRIHKRREAQLDDFDLSIQDRRDIIVRVHSCEQTAIDEVDAEGEAVLEEEASDGNEVNDREEE
jgi:hypothetical protein